MSVMPTPNANKFPPPRNQFLLRLRYAWQQRRILPRSARASLRAQAIMALALIVGGLIIAETPLARSPALQVMVQWFPFLTAASIGHTLSAGGVGVLALMIYAQVFRAPFSVRTLTYTVLTLPFVLYVAAAVEAARRGLFAFGGVWFLLVLYVLSLVIIAGYEDGQQ